MQQVIERPYSDNLNKNLPRVEERVECSLVSPPPEPLIEDFQRSAKKFFFIIQIKVNGICCNNSFPHL